MQVFYFVGSALLTSTIGLMMGALLMSFLAWRSRASMGKCEDEDALSQIVYQEDSRRKAARTMGIGFLISFLVLFFFVAYLAHIAMQRVPPPPW